MKKTIIHWWRNETAAVRRTMRPYLKFLQVSKISPARVAPIPTSTDDGKWNFIFPAVTATVAAEQEFFPYVLHFLCGYCRYCACSSSLLTRKHVKSQFSHRRCATHGNKRTSACAESSMESVATWIANACKHISHLVGYECWTYGWVFTIENLCPSHSCKFTSVHLNDAPRRYSKMGYVE